MADGEDKTEAPTPRKRQEARDNGQVPRSQDLTAAIMLVASTMLLWHTGRAVMGALSEITHDMIAANNITGTGVREAIAALGKIGLAIAPMFAGIMLVAVVANLLQTGLHLSTKKLEPKLENLNPLSGIKRLIGGGRGPMQLLMNIAKLVLAGLVAYSAIRGRLGDIISSQQLEFAVAFSLAGELVYSVALRVGVLLLVLAILDYAWQRFKFERDLRMTKQEVKEEMKKMEGDPHIKQRRRQIAMQRRMQRIKQSVPTADVIITNPTHYAIALKYDATGQGAPKVVAKGLDQLALRIRAIAQEHKVPIIERPPLARALYKSCEVGQEIPEGFYQAVAEVLAYVYELTGKMQQTREAESRRRAAS